MAGKTTVLAMIAGATLWLLTALPAAAGNCCSPPAPPSGCNCTPPPCCTPPSPPPQTPICCTPGHNINIPSVNVNVAASVVVNAAVNANARTAASAQGSVFVGGGGGGGIAPGAVGVIQGLNVEGQTRRTAYEATRSMFKKVVIQAFCFDDKEVPHPASQVMPDRDIEDSYDGELYRCIAGAHMQITVAEWKERISFEGGQTMSCQKGEALYHVPGAAAGGHGAGASLQCRPQKPARDCNERSLLRRFGAGIKILTIMYTERYTAYREETTGATASMGMSLDGGVGGVAY